MCKTVEIRSVGGQRGLRGSRGLRCLILRYAGHRVVLSYSDGGVLRRSSTCGVNKTYHGSIDL